MFIDAPVTLILLVLNGLVAVYTLFLDPSMVERLSFRPALVRGGREPWRWLTAGVVHVGLGHLLFNMLALWSFGPYVEATLGSVPYLLVYLGSDLAANALTYLRHRDNPAYSAVGASGAISGVVFSFVLFEPFARLFFFFVPMPAIVFAVLYVALSVYSAKQGGGRIAHEAHLGGAVGGVALTLLFFPAALGIFLNQLGF